MSRPQSSFFATAFSLAFVAGAAHAHSEVSTLGDIAALPLASVAGHASATFPASLSGTGAVFRVQEAEAGVYAAAYVLERTTDGTRVRVEIAGRGSRHTPLALGALVTAEILRTGAVLCAAGEPIAFVPNALGRAVLHAARVKA